jgi:hypothetical protein
VTCACGDTYSVPMPTTTTEQDVLRRAEHAHATGTSMRRAGCHFGDIPDVDHYMDANRIPMERAGEAFAAYLTLEQGWNGAIRRIDPQGH